MHKISYLTFVIFTLFVSFGFCQNLHLSLYGETSTQTALIDALQYSKQHSNFVSVTSEVDSMQHALSKLGYIENEIKKIEKVNDSTFHSYFSLKEKVEYINIYYNSKIIDKATLRSVSDNVFDDYFELGFLKISDALNTINIILSERGYPFTKLKLSDIKFSKNHNLIATLIIQTKKERRIINSINIKGYTKFPRSYLKNYLKIKQGQTFNLNEIRKRTELLNDLNFANQIKKSEVLFSKESTTLFMYLEKTKSNYFDGFLGFGTNEVSNNLEFDGYLNLDLTNNLNFGETFKLLYKSDENDQETFKTDITLPFLFKSPIGIDLQLQIFKKDSSFATVDQFAKLHYQVNSKHKIFTGIIKSESNSLLNQNSTASIVDYKTSYYSFAYEYLKPQNTNTLFPIASRLYIESNFGKRELIDEFQKQSQINFKGFNIFNLNKKNSIYTAFTSSILNSDTYLENELFRFGGITSIRGFEENSIFASFFGLINTEYRLQLTNSIFIHSIIDAAYFENKIDDIKQKLYGYGFGFGILTKAGLFRFNFANGKIENQKFNFSNSKIHISLITNF